MPLAMIREAAAPFMTSIDPRGPEFRKALIPQELNVVLATVEVQRGESHDT